MKLGKLPGMARAPRADDFLPTGVGLDMDDLADGEPLAVVVRQQGRLAAAILPASVSKLSGDQLEVVSDLQHLAADIADRQMQLGRLVDEARDLGVSWVAIGWSVGTTGEAARQRFGASERSVPPPAPARKRPAKRKASSSRGQRATRKR